MSATDPRAFSWPPGTQIEPDGQIVFRPSWENYRSKMFKVPAFLALIVAFNLFRLDDPVVAIGLLVVGLGIGLLGTWIYFQRAMTSVGPRGLIHKDLFRSVTAPAERLGLVIYARDLRHYDARVDTSLIICDTEAKKLAMFNGPFWSKEQLYAMASALQRPTWQPDVPVSYAEIKDRYPKAVSNMYAHPWLFAFGLVGAIILAVIVIAVIVVAATG